MAGLAQRHGAVRITQVAGEHAHDVADDHDEHREEDDAVGEAPAFHRAQRLEHLLLDHGVAHGAGRSGVGVRGMGLDGVAAVGVDGHL
ncbi:hypothetical protein [Micrococcus luteus]|uniref:hypothetical protein n=1 Tax=Micrococcus luteus TaxID=1270 RepID=UPI0020131518|nr:hypothetical protein [Micrococcus luteus]